MWAIALIILALLYAAIPLDLLPDGFIGVGWLDDLIVLGLAVRYAFVLKKKAAGARSAGARFRRGRQSGNAGGQNGENGPPADREDTAPWDPHRVLGIDRNATGAEIKTAYRRLANMYHPDKVAHLGNEFKELAEFKFKEIQRAYQELSRPGPT